MHTTQVILFGVQPWKFPQMPRCLYVLVNCSPHFGNTYGGIPLGPSRLWGCFPDRHRVLPEDTELGPVLGWRSSSVQGSRQSQTAGANKILNSAIMHHPDLHPLAVVPHSAVLSVTQTKLLAQDFLSQCCDWKFSLQDQTKEGERIDWLLIWVRSSCSSVVKDSWQHL